MDNAILNIGLGAIGDFPLPQDLICDAVQQGKTFK